MTQKKKGLLDNHARNKRIVTRLCKEIKKFKELRQKYDDENDKQGSHESHLIWYYLFGCLGKDSDQLLDLVK